MTIEDILLRLPSPIVFDHIGRLPRPGRYQSSGISADPEADRQGKGLVKISGVHLNTRVGPPGYAGATAIVHANVKHALERLIWGSDWPHPTEEDSKPDDAVVFDLLAGWAPDETTRDCILVANPETLYGFPQRT